MSRRRRDRAPAGVVPEVPRPFPWAWATFAAAFVIRLLYWRATADAGWPHTAAFKGDAILWLEYARALRDGAPFELGLPIHPPGAAYLVAALWSSGGFGLLKVVWCALGAAAAGLFTAAIARAFGTTAAALAGTAMAGSTGLLMLSTSLNAETPYLALVGLGFWLLPGTDAGPSRGRLAAWAAVQAVACLFRVEHVLFAAFAAAWIAARSLRRAPREAILGLAVAAVAFVVPLVPWHARAWRAVERFNRELPATSPPMGQLLDQLRRLPWEAAARARLDALPAFARDHTEAFVAATVVHRGGTVVRESDLDVIRQAFGVEQRAIAPRPFVSIYGPLNFALASHPASPAGFGHGALDVPPPLEGGPSAYPAMLLTGLPPRELAFVYPPHLALVNDGYRMGVRWLLADPGKAARRALERASRFWAGAATMMTGYGLPGGLSGTRSAVDITVSDGWLAVAWRVVVLAACVAGLAAGYRRAALYPWLLFLATKLVAAVAFFGYARLGATTIPVTALLLALAASRFALADLTPARERRLRIALAALVVVEAVRFVSAPSLTLDGDPAGPRDPVASSDSMDHRFAVGR